MVENLVSQVLLELFGMVIVEKVKICFVEEDHWGYDTFPGVAWRPKFPVHNRWRLVRDEYQSDPRVRDAFRTSGGHTARR